MAAQPRSVAAGRAGAGRGALGPRRVTGEHVTQPPRTPVVRSDYGLPYSKGLMAQSIMATGLPPERSFALAAEIERALTGTGVDEVDVEHLREVAEVVLAAEENPQVVKRFGQWWRLRRLERPLVVMIGGVTGVGKSTIATQLA